MLTVSVRVTLHRRPEMVVSVALHTSATIQRRRQRHGHSSTSPTHARRLFLLSDDHSTLTTPATLLPLPPLCLLESL